MNYHGASTCACLIIVITRDERKEQVMVHMAARQKKRSDNIAMQNERRKGKGKAKARPGFEGKSYAKGKGKALGKK